MINRPTPLLPEAPDQNNPFLAPLNLLIHFMRFRHVSHQLKETMREIRQSRLFDDDYYLAAYPDIRAAGRDPLLHYCSQGWREGRNPSADFDTTFYLAPI